MDKTTPDFLTSWLGRWLGRIKPDGNRSHWMASVKRIPTGYKGVFYVERKGERILSIFYRKPDDRKQYEAMFAQALRVGHQPKPMQNALAESMVKG